MKLSKIMIIEDDPVIQGELQTLLNGNGYTTLGVRNFSAVTEQIQDEKPHLILLDIKLPGEKMVLLYALKFVPFPKCQSSL